MVWNSIQAARNHQFVEYYTLLIKLYAVTLARNAVGGWANLMIAYVALLRWLLIRVIKVEKG